MKKAIIIATLAAGLGSLLSTSPALALGPVPNGKSLNGISLNGKSLNGISLNGNLYNGSKLNGGLYNGSKLNGSMYNGSKLNGGASNGTKLKNATAGSEVGVVTKGACLTGDEPACQSLTIQAIELSDGRRVVIR
jgi:hypothetical protein